MRNIIVTTALILGITLLLQGAGCQSVEFTTAKMAFQQKDYDKANDFLSKELLKNPNNAEAYALAAQVNIQRREFVDAAKALVKASSLARSGKDKKLTERIDTDILTTWNIFYANSFEYYKTYKADKKVESLDSAISLCVASELLRPTNPIFPGQLGYFYEEKGDTANAMVEYKKIVDLIDKEIEFAKDQDLLLNMDRATALTKIGGNISKTRIDTLKEDKKDVGFYRYSDQIKLENGKELFLSSEKKKDESEATVKGWFYDPSEEWRIEEKTMFNDFNLDPYFILSQNSFEHKDYNKAIQYLRRVTLIDPENKTANTSIVQMYQMSGNTRVAEQELTDLITANPKSKIYYGQYGDLLSNTNRTNEAITQYTKALEIDPEYDLALYNIAVAYKNRAAAKQAIEKEAKDNNPKYVEKTSEYYPDLETSAQYFTKALDTKKFKDNFNILVELVNISTILGKDAELNKYIANLEKLEYTLPKADRERYYLEMMKIFSFKKDETKTRKYQDKYEKLNK